MEAAFAAGADIVELDVHPTTDGHFAVFHDWKLECRTDGVGVTRRQDTAYLKSLDIGFGYTADNGRTFPFRGAAAGAMPTLREVFSAIPYGRFVVNFKSRDKHEAEMLAGLISENPEWRSLLWGVYGGDPPTFRAKALLGHGVAAWSERSVVDCLSRYLAIGWTGYMPSACRDTAIMVPINAAPWLWGFPHRMVRRFEAVGSQVILVGPYDGEAGAGTIDTLKDLERVPPDFNGYIWTNKVELIGPELKSDVASGTRIHI